MTSAALVLFMTLPGLALFYGGLVRRKNVLSVMAQCFFITGMVTILWWHLRLQPGLPPRQPAFLGDLGFAFLNNVDSSPNRDYSCWVSQNVFAMYQLMFAIITPALIIGAIAERMKFSAIFLFMTLWMLVVYFPQAHMIWGVDGMMNGVVQSRRQNPRHRLRRRHGRPHDFRLVGPGAVPDPGQAPGLRQRELQPRTAWSCA